AWSPRLPWVPFGFFVGLAGIGLALSALNGSRGGGGLLSDLINAAIFIAMAVIGTVIASRQPQNPIGWLLQGTTGLVAVGFVADEYARYTYLTNPGALPGGQWAVWFGFWVWVVGIGAMVTFLFLLFPDGRLPSRRWRMVAWAVSGTILVVAVAGMVTP